MLQDLKDFPRPQNDNGRGLHGSLDATWTGGEQGMNYWINLLVEMNIKWFTLLDDGGSSLPWCKKLLAADIFPIVRILRRDPPPNDTPEPNPGHISSKEEATIRKLCDLGVRYFETNNEPNLSAEWKTQAFPANLIEAAKLVALNWLFDARLILSLGAFPGLPAISSGGEMDLIGALATLGRQNILLEGCWIALHNSCENRPLTYPDDPINRTGQMLSADQYSQDAPWVWWNNAHGRPDSLDAINEMRANLANPAPSFHQNHACFREFEYYNTLAVKYLGRSIPIISTAGGYRVGHREDMRYPRVTPQSHCEQTIALYDFMQHQAPDYYFTATPSLLVESDEHQPEAWHSSFWKRATTNAPFGFEGIPNIPLPESNLGDELPVIAAVKQMQTIARRMPGDQPLPPAPISIPMPPASRPVAPSRRAVATASWLSDADDETPATREPIPAKPVKEPKTPEPIAEEIHVPAPAPIIAEPVESDKPELVAEEIPTLAPIVAAEPTIEEAIESIEPEPVAEEIPTPAPIVPAELTIEELIALTEQETVKEEMLAPAPVIPEPVIETIPAPVAPSRFASMPPPPPPEEFSPAPEPPAAPIFVEPEPLAMPSLSSDEVEWDWRLDALGVSLEPASVKPGQTYWRLVRADYESPNEANDGHQIYYTALDQQNRPIEYQKVLQGWTDGETDAITNEKGEANIPMWVAYAPERFEQGPYSAWIDGMQCDRVRGMGLPSKRHVNFRLTWKRSVATFLDTERRR